jgi:hypothetical protein
MSLTYEIRSASGRVLSQREAGTAQQAAIDYARSMGCSDDEIIRIANDTVSWRGAQFTAVPKSTELETQM